MTCVCWWVVMFDWLDTHLFFSFLTLINRILHWPRCAVFSDNTEILLLTLSLPLLIYYISAWFLSSGYKRLWLNITVKLFSTQMWHSDILNDNIFYFVFLSQFYFHLYFVFILLAIFCHSFALLYVRGHLQGGSSLSSSVTSSAARRVRQLPQLPPKSSTVEQGIYSWLFMFLTLHITHYQPIF